MKEKTSKVVGITGKRCIEIAEKPMPKASGEFVLVKILVTPMCTEYKWFDNGTVSPRLGHEAAGEVVEVAQPGRVKVGDRVVVMPGDSCGKCPLCLSGDYLHCQHMLDVPKVTGSEWATATYAQYLLKQDWLLVPIPDGISYEHAGMACCGLGPTFGAMQRMRVDAFDSVLITGMGPVGLGGVINGVFRGAKVIAVESHPYRVRLAKELGAAAVIDPREKDALKQIMDLTGGVGVDKAVDCTGVPAAQSLIVHAARRRGHVAFVGEAGDFTMNVSNDMLRKGLTLHGAWHYNLADAPKIMQVIGSSAALLNKLITHTFPLGKVKDALELQVTHDCGKALLYPWR